MITFLTIIKSTQNHHLMFLAPQIRAFIIRVLYHNSKSPGNRYLPVKKCVDNINGNFLCLIASSLKCALKTKAHGDKYLQETHKGELLSSPGNTPANTVCKSTMTR